MRRHRALAVIAAILILFTSQAWGQQPVHRVGVLSNAQLPENIQAWEATLRDRGYVSDECQATTGSASPTCAPI